MALGPFDIIFCRNVLIYFDDSTKKLILRGLRSRLHPDGYLLLGGAEAILQLDDRLREARDGRSGCRLPAVDGLTSDTMSTDFSVTTLVPHNPNRRGRSLPHHAQSAHRAG